MARFCNLIGENIRHTELLADFHFTFIIPGLLSLAQMSLALALLPCAATIDTACGINYFHNLKQRSWDALNSYTHTGVLQLGRRFTGDKLEPSYKDGEKIEVIRTATTMLLLIVRPFLAKHGHQNEAVQIDQIGAKYVTACKQT